MNLHHELLLLRLGLDRVRIQPPAAFAKIQIATADLQDAPWDGAQLHDALEAAERQGWRRRCLACGETDVKFAIHSKSTVGCEASAMCNDCKNGEAVDRQECEHLVRNWHDTGAASSS